MPDERRQFRILYRDFLFRMVDLELLSARGEIQNLLGQIAALLAAFSFVLALLLVPGYTSSSLPRQRLLTAAWGHEEFLIATSARSARSDRSGRTGSRCLPRRHSCSARC